MIIAFSNLLGKILLAELWLEKPSWVCLWSKKPLEIAINIFKAQGWDGSYPNLHTEFMDWSPKESGFIAAMDNETIGWAGVALGAGRKVLTDSVDPRVGFYFYKKV